MVTHYQCSKSLEEKPLLVQNTQQEKKKQHQTLQSMHPQTASKKLSSSCKMSDSSSQEPKKMTERGGQCRWMGQ